MQREKSIFYKLIKCNNCKVNYRKIQDRKQINYICQSYSTQKNTCSERNTLKELDLLSHILKTCSLKNWEYEETNEYMQEIISHIIALPNGCFEIYFKDGTVTYLKENGVKYI